MVKTPLFHCRGHGFGPWLGELRSHGPHGVVNNEGLAEMTSWKRGTGLRSEE